MLWDRKWERLKQIKKHHSTSKSNKSGLVQSSAFMGHIGIPLDSIPWIQPPPSNSHHEDYCICSREQPEPLFVTGILRGGEIKKITMAISFTARRAQNSTLCSLFIECSGTGTRRLELQVHFTTGWI